MSESNEWDVWHDFPGTSPEGHNPCAGDEVQVELKDKLTRFTDADPIYRVVKWDVPTPKGLVGPRYGLVRWRHRDPVTAKNWRVWLEDGPKVAPES